VLILAETNPIDSGKTRSGLGGGMSGFGSGSWYRWRGKESTLEESLVVAMRDFRKRIYPHSAGTFTWTWAAGLNDEASVGAFGDPLPISVPVVVRESGVV
jgi:hypothetical protein